MTALAPQHMSDAGVTRREPRDGRNANLTKLLLLLAEHGDVQVLPEHRLVSVLVSRDAVSLHYPDYPFRDERSAVDLDMPNSRAVVELHSALATLGARYRCHYSVRSDLLVTFPAPESHGHMLYDARSTKRLREGSAQ